MLWRSVTSLCILASGSEARLAPHRERLRDRPCDASATYSEGSLPTSKVPSPAGCVEREKEEVVVPAQCLRCRICDREHALEAVGVCARCFGPLDPVYDRDELRRTVTREAIESGPPSLWRYAALLPVEPPAEQRLAPGLTPLVDAPRLADELGVGRLYLKLDTANPTHSFKDRVVAVASAKALELGLGTLACSSTGNLANAVAARAAAEGIEAVVLCPSSLEPEKLTATAVYGATIYAVDGSYDDCSRIAVELSFELDWAFVNVGLRSYYAEGSKTLGFEIAEQLGWRLPDAVVAPIASGALFAKVSQGFDELRDLGLVDGRQPRLYGGQAEGCAPVATAFASGAKVTPVKPATVARSLAIGSPADGDLAVATARRTGGAIHAVAEEEIGENMALLAETTGVFGETAAGVTLGALREAVRSAAVGEEDTVVLLVTGDGLKTPQPIAGRLRPVHVEADADALLERLGVGV
jgi:threonine synthase